MSEPIVADEELAELERLLAAASGPWYVERGAWISGPDHKGIIADCGPSYGSATPAQAANAALIVAAINALPALLAAVHTPDGGGDSTPPTTHTGEPK